MPRDMTSGTRTLHQQSRVLARFKAENPLVPEQGPNQGTDQSTRVERLLGSLQFVVRGPGGSQESSAVLLPPRGVTNLTANGGSTETINGIVYTKFDLTWTPDPTATDYELIVNYSGAIATQIINNSVTALLPSWNGNTVLFGIKSVNAAGSSIKYTSVACFLAGSPVSMADGTVKAIEEVAVGDQVIGAFGEINDVLALQHVFVGTSTMYKINGEHDTTDHHPHVSVDKKFYTPEPAIIDTVYGKSYPVIGPEGLTTMNLGGLRKGRAQKLELGHVLKTIDGSRTVNTLEAYSLPPETPLYNLVIGGSHTYHVNGYAVTGWPREDDFDYDLWTQR
jgi:hypothetical protein